MKIPDSGMPDESYWNSLFDIPRIVTWLDLATVRSPIVEIGCGYGTFTIPVARATGVACHAFDIDPSMIEWANRNAQSAGIHTVLFYQRDVLEKGTGLDSDVAGMVLLFNILHFKERRTLLAESYRILGPNGRVAIIHWRKDIETPRGPARETRPDSHSILEAADGLDFCFEGDARILEPYHWGIQLRKRHHA